MSAQPDMTAREGELPLPVLAAMTGGASLVMLAGLLGLRGAGRALVVVFGDGLMAALVLLSAGGWGFVVYRRFRPPGASRALELATSGGLGLHLLAAAMLLAGSLPIGALSPWAWWPVVAVGAALALRRVHRALAGAELPRRVSGGQLVWVLAAAGAAAWLAGAALPAGWLGNLSGDARLALGRYLELPRRFLHEGMVLPSPSADAGPTPLAMEMLYLLGMCLRDGAYQGMYLAKLMHGLFGVLTVAAVWGMFSGKAETAGAGDADGEDDSIHRFLARFRGRSAVALLATSPWVIYLAQLSLAELAATFWLVLGLAWLRPWLAQPDWRHGVWVGLSAGAACAYSFGAALTVAAPLLATMLVLALPRPARLGAVLPAVGAALAGLAPFWGRAAILGELLPGLSALAGGPTSGAAQTAASRLVGLLLNRGPQADWPAVPAVVLLVAAGAVAAMLLRPRRTPSADWMELLVLLLGGAAWAAAMPGASALEAAPLSGPIVLLAAGGLARLAGVRQVRWLRPPPAGGHWGLAPATLLAAASALVGLLAAREYFRAQARFRPVEPAAVGAPAGAVRKSVPAFAVADALPADSRLMLVGESRAFYFPPETMYSVPPQWPPLARFVGLHTTPPKLAAALRQAGVTHVLVTWTEIDLIASWPRALAPERIVRLTDGWPVLADRYWTPPAATSQPAAAGAASASAPTSAATAAATQPARRWFTLLAVPN